MLWLLSAVAHAHIPVIYIVGPDDDWCGTIDEALGGDVVMLLPGDYVGPCDIVSEASDPVGEMSSVQSFDASDPARLVHDGVSDHVLSVSGELFTLLQIDIGPLPAGVTGIEVRDGADLTIRYSTVDAGEGTALRQVGQVDTLRLLDNRFVDRAGVALDVGCDGACSPGALLVEGNVIEGGSGTLRVRSTGEVEVGDNNAFDHGGLALDIVAPAAIVHRNHIDGDVWAEVARFDSNIVRGGLDGSGTLAFSTLLSDVRWGGATTGNATLATDLGGDNVLCDASCFTDLEAGDYFPAPGSPLREAVARSTDVTVDWCDNLRGDPASAGAVEGLGAESFGPIHEGYKALQDCRVEATTTPTPGEPPPTGATGDTGAAGPEGPIEGGEGAGCGCAAARASGASGFLAWGIGVPWAIRRRRDRAGGKGGSVG